MKYEQIDVEVVLLASEDVLTLSAADASKEIDSYRWNDIFPNRE